MDLTTLNLLLEATSGAHLRMNKKKLEEGDIFYVIVNEKFVFARLLMDVDERILKLEPEHKMKFKAGCYLIEVFKGIYEEPELLTDEIILPGQFTVKKSFYSKNYKIEWVFYRYEPIDYTKLDFPENLENGKNGMVNFRKFDLSIPTKTSFDNFPVNNKGNQKYTGSICTSYYQMPDEAFHLQGRDDLMMVADRTYFLNNSDLRLDAKDRERFYGEIGENPDTGYYELAMKHGFDLGRFYK